MNTILSVALFAAILTLALVIRTMAGKFLKALEKSNPAASQNEWHGNRVRASIKQ